jgi:Zn-finger nucleic acid-binding protein
MASSSSSVLSCPNCTAPLVQISVGSELELRSCSRCDRRWWRRGDAPATIGAVLDVVAESGRAPRSR